MSSEKLKTIYAESQKIKVEGTSRDEVTTTNLSSAQEETKDTTKGRGSSNVNIIILYPIDKSDTYCEPRDTIPTKSLSLLRGIWHDEKQIEPISEFKWEKVLEDNHLLSDFQSQLLDQR
jgi:hypothetical protein